MSQSGQLLPAYLKPEAFAVALEIKEEQGSPYDGKAECIANYPKGGTPAEKKPFQDQFYQLIEKFAVWGEDNGLYTDLIDDNFILFKDNIFHPQWAENSQNAAYFEKIKSSLEKIYLLLNNEQVSPTKKISVYNDLCDMFSVCSPGLDIHIENAYFSLSSNTSLNYWLAEKRNNIIRCHADEYNEQHHISEICSVHTLKPLAHDAAEQNWNPSVATSHIKDTHVPKVTKEEFIAFRKYFVGEFNPNAIRECIKTNLHFELNNIFEALKLNNEKNPSPWKDAKHTNYTEFVKRATNLINSLGIYSKNGMYDFLENSEDYTEFRPDIEAIVDLLCQQVLSPELYFDPVNKQYYKLIPYQWIDRRYPLEMIDFTVWDNIPDKDFPSVLCRMLKEIDGKHVKQLLKNISNEKLQTIHKNEAFSKTLSSVINNKEKEAYIVGKVSKILSVPEEKHQSFQPGENKPLDELLLHIVHGRQDEAEAIIKANPKLVFMSGNVQAPSGDIFMDYSPLKLACYMHDMDMVEMMKPYAYQVQYGEEQFNSLLKEAGEAFNNRKTYDFAKLADVITSGDEEEIKKALDQFRKRFEPKYIKNKKSFNIQNLIKAYEIYISNYDVWSKEHGTLYWCQVIGYLQRSLPICCIPIFYTQQVLEGNSHKGLRRQIILASFKDFYPAVKNEPKGLGYDYAIYGAPAYKPPAKFFAFPYKTRLETCVKRKQERCNELTETPVLADLLHDVVKLCPEDKKDSYFYLLAILVQNHWGKYYAPDNLSRCEQAGILNEESYKVILNGFESIFFSPLKFNGDFLAGYALVAKELKPEYLKLMIKQKDFFKSFSISDEERLTFTAIIHEEISGKSFLYYLLKECDVDIAKQFIKNATVFELDQLGDIWTEIYIYKLFDLEENQCPEFLQLALKKIPPVFLAEIIKEPNNNPFNNKKLQEDFCNMLDLIGTKLKPQDLANLILKANIDHYYMLSNFDIFNKLSELLPAPLLLNIFVSKNLLPKAFDPEHNSSRAITSIVVLMIRAFYVELKAKNPEKKQAILSHLKHQYIIYNGITTNFLGYFILRNNDKEDAFYYNKIFVEIPRECLLDCFNNMGIQDFTISLTMLDYIIQNVPKGNISDIFKVNFTISENVPQEKFIHDLFQLLSYPALIKDDITTLFERISYETLAAMAKSEYYAINLDTIKNSDKQEFIVETISKRLTLREYKEEKEEKTVTLNQHQFFQPGKNELFDRLLMHVVRGEQEQAEVIIREHPELLFQSGNVTDLSGNTFIDYSPCQLAAYAHDEHMLKMMAGYLDRVKDGEAQFVSIIKEADEAADAQVPYDFSLLIDAITANSDEEIAEALRSFRHDFGPHTIRYEKSFSLNHLLIANEIYRKKYDDHSWNFKQLLCFRTHVIGYLQRSLPACYAQAICQRVTSTEQPLKRKLLLEENGMPFYSPEAGRGLGYDYAIRTGSRYLGKLYETKRRTMRDIVKQLDEKCRPKL